MAEFWGIEFQNHSKKETLKIVDDYLVESNSKDSLIITTLNPELLLFAEKDDAYRNILNSADLKNVDGFGVKLMGWFKNRKVSERIAGVDLAGHVLKNSIKNKLKIAFVFKKDGLSNNEDIRSFCDKFSADVRCVEYDVEKKDAGDIDLQLQDREIVLVGSGAPYQERFIYENKNNWPNLKLAIGVGGAFDFWTGKQKRAPKFIRKIGMEWLWRLFFFCLPSSDKSLHRLKRFRKIWKSTIVFILKSLIK